VIVQLGEAATREAYTYVSARRCAGDVAPADWYLARIVAGAREHGLPEAWGRSLDSAHGARGEIRDAGDRVCTEASSRWRRLRTRAPRTDTD
jgi:hypothetical protein